MFAVSLQTGVFSANGTHYRIDSINGAVGEEDRALISKLGKEAHPSNSFKCSNEEGMYSSHTASIIYKSTEGLYRPVR